MPWVDDRAVHIGENLELVGDPQVVAIRRKPVGDNALRICFSLKGSIIPCWSACSRIQRSLCMDMPLLFLARRGPFPALEREPSILRLGTAAGVTVSPILGLAMTTSRTQKTSSFRQSIPAKSRFGACFRLPQIL